LKLMIIICIVCKWISNNMKKINALLHSYKKNRMIRIVAQPLLFSNKYRSNSVYQKHDVPDSIFIYNFFVLSKKAERWPSRQTVFVNLNSIMKENWTVDEEIKMIYFFFVNNEYTHSMNPLMKENWTADEEIKMIHFFFVNDEYTHSVNSLMK